MKSGSTTKWYVQDGAERIGPLSSAELKALAADGRLTRESMVWRTGLHDWVPAGSIRGLSLSPLSQQVSQVQPLGSETVRQAAPRSRSRMPILLALLFGGAIILGAAVFVSQQDHVWDGLATTSGDDPRQAALIQLSALSTAVDQFQAEMRRLPTSQEGLSVLWSSAAMARQEDKDRWGGPYLRNPAPLDPWGRAWVYLAKATPAGEDYTLLSAGPDGVPNTEDDISSHASAGSAQPALSRQYAAPPPRETQETIGPRVKGIALGMNIHEAANILASQLSKDDWEIETKKAKDGTTAVIAVAKNGWYRDLEDWAGLGTTAIASDSDEKVIAFRFDAYTSRELFNASGMSHREFAESCSKAYGLPDLTPDQVEKPHPMGGGSTFIPVYRGTSPDGWEILISGKAPPLPGGQIGHEGLAIVVRQTVRQADRRFD